MKALNTTTILTSARFEVSIDLTPCNGRDDRPRLVTQEIRKGLREQKLIAADDNVHIEELVFDYAHAGTQDYLHGIGCGKANRTGTAPAIFYANGAAGDLSTTAAVGRERRLPFSGRGAQKSRRCLSIRSRCRTLCGEREPFHPELRFCRRRCNLEVKGHGRMLRISFRRPRPSRRPLAIGAQLSFWAGVVGPRERKPVGCRWKRGWNIEYSFELLKPIRSLMRRYAEKYRSSGADYGLQALCRCAGPPTRGSAKSTSAFFASTS
jgi:hypothetical protein